MSPHVPRGSTVLRPFVMVCVVIGLTVAACGTPRPLPSQSLTWVSVPAADGRVRYTGRTYRSATGVVFSHPGVTIRASFWGDALRMKLHDAGLGGEVGTNYFDVSIDGAAPQPLAVHRDQPTYVLATGLAVGPHTVELVKRTESSVGSSELVALEVHGELQEPPARTAPVMEFIGDSITCGYGTEVSGIPQTPFWRAPTFTSAHQNPRRGYAWLTALSLGAEPVLVCYSGRGIYRNLDASTSGLLPALYELAVPDHAVPWDFSQASPDVIVVNAGTNDTFAGHGTTQYLPDEAAFKSAYRAFLQRLRTLHPRAHIICTLGSMTDGHKETEGTDKPSSVHVGHWLTDVVTERQRQGDVRVYRHEMAEQVPELDGVAEDWHPSAATHLKMAEALRRFIEAQLIPLPSPRVRP
ncbi:SGNH/GDSL hydrolase family protein [Myxococcus qinghaiensis]|uniref:SGNH/GDSL hydrolase family protein n=1 Tax=Myxococcus qinghaiensis TaxID=2906758 RepID=UPI0020A7B0D9|nr:SGNH/GDSL hydrolase family protein [Myxococcus qinghaiensis]